MKILSVKKEKLDVVFEIELDSKEWAKSFANSKNRITKNIQIPGFRKGHAPKAMVDERVSKEQIAFEALRPLENKMLQELFESKEFDKEDCIESVREMEIVKLNEKEAVIKVHCDLIPEISGFKSEDIKKIEIPEFEGQDIPEQYIEFQIKQMVKNDCMISNKKEPVIAKGDIAVINFKGFVDGKAFAGGEAKNYELEIGSKSFVDNFEDQLIGLNKGDKKDVIVTFPKDYNPELAGKEAKFEVEIVDVKEIEYPEFNKEYLAKFGIEANSKAELIAYFKKMFKDQAELQYRDRALAIINNEVASKVKLSHYPESLVNQHKNQLIQQYNQEAQKQGFKDLDDLKKKNKVDDAKFNEQLTLDAKKYLGLALAIDKMITDFEIKVSAADKKDLLEKLTKYFGSEDKAKEIMEKNPDYYEAFISREKLFKKLIELAKKVKPAKEEKK